jgi:hypothetical protein
LVIDPDYGYTGTFWLVGESTLFGCVIAANMKIILFSNSYSGFLMFSVIGSILVYLITSYIISSMTTSATYGVALT